MHRIHTSLPEIITVAVKPGRRSIGFLTKCNSSSLLDCGLEVRHGDIVLNRSDVVHQRSGAECHYGAVSFHLMIWPLLPRQSSVVNWRRNLTSRLFARLLR